MVFLERQMSETVENAEHAEITECAEITEHAEITEQTEETIRFPILFRAFRYFRVFRVLAVVIFAILTLSPCAFAQFRPTGRQAPETQGTQAKQLPLSGRSGQTGTVTTTQTPTPGTTTSVNTINPSIQTQGPFGGSVAGAARVPFSGRLSLREAVERGIDFNLGAVGLTNAVIESRGQRKVARSALLPNLSGYLSETVQQINLQAAGFNLGQLTGQQFSQLTGQQIPGISIPTVIGPFNFFDPR